MEVNEGLRADPRWPTPTRKAPAGSSRSSSATPLKTRRLMDQAAYDDTGQERLTCRADGPAGLGSTIAHRPGCPAGQSLMLARKARRRSRGGLPRASQRCWPAWPWPLSPSLSADPAAAACPQAASPTNRSRLSMTTTLQAVPLSVNFRERDQNSHARHRPRCGRRAQDAGPDRQDHPWRHQPCTADGATSCRPPSPAPQAMDLPPAVTEPPRPWPSSRPSPRRTS